LFWVVDPAPPTLALMAFVSFQFANFDFVTKEEEAVAVAALKFISQLHGRRQFCDSNAAVENRK